jgi:hypothetical protein
MTIPTQAATTTAMITYQFERGCFSGTCADNGGVTGRPGKFGAAGTLLASGVKAETSSSDDCSLISKGVWPRPERLLSWVRIIFFVDISMIMDGFQLLSGAVETDAQFQEYPDYSKIALMKGPAPGGGKCVAILDRQFA